MPSAVCHSPYIMYCLVISINVVSNGLSFFISYVPDQFPRHTGCHYSCGLHGITDMILGIAPLLLLQMERVIQSGDACTQYAVPRGLAGPNGERIMEGRPNSDPDTPYPPLPIRRALTGEMPLPVWSVAGPVRTE